MIMIATITRKETLAQYATGKDFARSVFADNNRFTLERFATRAGLHFDEAKTVTQKELLIAGKAAHKNKLQCVFNDKLLFTSVIYVIESGDRYFLLSFQASPKASDNDEVELALEQATAIKDNQ